jgi:hypothetical protein
MHSFLPTPKSVRPPQSWLLLGAHRVAVIGAAVGCLGFVLFSGCGEDDSAAEDEAQSDEQAQEGGKNSGDSAPSLDLAALVDTKLYGLRNVPDRTKVKGRIAVGTYVSSKKNKAGSHWLVEVTVSPCRGCTPASEQKAWKFQTENLLRAKRKIDSSAVFEMEKVTWKEVVGTAHYSFLFKAKKSARGKIYQAEHAYTARFSDAHYLLEVKTSPCDSQGHPFAKTREQLFKAATKKELKRATKRVWLKLSKYLTH